MKTIGELLSSSFLGWGRASLTYATHPKVRRKSTSGFLPCLASNGVCPAKLFVGALFSKNTAVVTASPQNAAGTDLPLSRLRAMVMTDWFRRSTTPFCWGVLGAEC